MKKRFLSLIMVMILSLGVAPNVSAINSEFTSITGWDMMKKLGIGITFANTTEARAWPRENSNPTDTESYWGQPRIEKWHIQAVAEKGFDSYRLCVTWTTHMNKNNKIDPIWMDRVQEIVDWALDEELNVVLNTHHEEELYWLIRDGKYDAAKKHLNTIWSQVAERFKDYPESLIFEIMNEPNLLEYYQGPGEWVNENGQVSRTLCDTVSKLNKDALDTIRKSGGHNDKRVVMLCAPGGSISTLPYMDIPNDPYIIFGAFGYGESLNESSMDNIRDMLNKGIGFVNKEDNSSSESWKGINLEQFTKDHFYRFAKMGVPSFFFNGCASFNDESVSFYNRITGEWVNNTILNSFFAAYGRKPNTSMLKSRVVEIGRGESYQLRSKEYSAKTIKWTTSNKAIVKINKNGIAKGMKIGKAVVTATVEGVKTNIEVTVKKAPKKISAENITINKDNTTNIKAILPYGTASKVLTYKTSDNNIASINTEGVVKGISAGNCIITIKTFNGKSVKVKVKVIGDYDISSIGFESDNAVGFTSRGGGEKVTVTSEQAHSGSKSLLVSDRTASWQGAQLYVNKYIISNNTYDISAWVMLKSINDANIRLSTQVGQGDRAKYFTIEEKNIAKKDGWVKLSGKFTYEDSLSPFDFVTIYIEGGDNADKTEYYIDDVSFKKVD